jgi:N-acyl-D-aspartate/D-glutamate deacylase
MRPRFALFASLLPFATGSCARPDALPYDVLITDARVVDGTGAPWYRADVAVQGGRIAAIGRLQARPARVRINALNRVVTPGFIDMMGGSSLPLYRDPVSGHSKITQGITTMLVGEGGSLAPQNERTIAAAAPGMDSVITWRAFGEYFRLLEAKGIALNVVHNVGAAQVRLAVIGEEGREPTPEELDAMRALVRQAMEDGAVGLSTALIYPPGTYATTEELIELAKVVAQYGGAYFSHMRNESAQLLEAIAEVARIAQAAGIPGHIYHLKAAGQENWPLMPRALDLITRGLGSFLHPRHYVAGEDAFLATLSDPAVRARLRAEVETTSDWENWYRHVGRNWDNVLITAARAEEDRPLVGRSVREAARALGRSEWDAFFDLVQRGGVSVAPQSMNEEQKQQAMRAPFVMFDTDAAPVNPAEVASAHPRAFGTFPRILARYVREEGVLSLEAAVQRMTALPANRLGLQDRGRIAEGLAADLVVFNPETVRDVATFTDPLRYSEGIDYVMVNGRLVVDAGRVTGAMPGLVLRHRR